MYGRLLDTEVGVLGDELVKAQDQLDALTDRFAKLQARVGMRDLRASRKGAGQNDDALIEELRAAAAARGKPAKSNGGEHWPEIE